MSRRQIPPPVFKYRYTVNHIAVILPIMVDMIKLVVKHNGTFMVIKYINSAVSLYPMKKVASGTIKKKKEFLITGRATFSFEIFVVTFSTIAFTKFALFIFIT